MGGLTLPPAAWRERPDLIRLCDVLGAREGLSRFVGGSVRDTLLGMPVADIDIATRLSPDQVIDRLKAGRITAVPTGIAHGTVTAVLPDGPVEITTLRRDLSTDGRHAIVAFTDDWREDAARRDFTINALYADPLSGEIFDYFGGHDDLLARTVRFIGDALERIAEDHLRILRFFRFLARFGEKADAAGLEACRARANDLMALSRERIAAELLKLVVAKHAVRVTELMIGCGILLPVLPEIDMEGVKRLAQVEAGEIAADLTPDPIRRLAALLPRTPALGETIGARLKLSKAQRRRLMLALDDATASPHELAYRLGKDGAIDRWLLTEVDAGEAERGARAIAAWDIPTFPISGGAFVRRGIDKGPEVAQLLHRVEDQWIAENFPDAARVEQLADAAVAQRALIDRKS